MTNDAREIEVYRPPESAAVALWGTDEPREMTARMTAVADALADAVKTRNMSIRIGNNEYVKAEGWSMVGAMIGVFPRPVSVDEIRNAEGDLVGFRATIELVNRDGGIVGGAVALCTKDEERWKNSEWNQIASMAQTRATGKAYRQTLGFIMPMAGYLPTPAEEMDGVVAAPRREPTQRRPNQQRAQSPEHGPQQPPAQGQRRKLKNEESDAIKAACEKYGVTLQGEIAALLGEAPSAGAIAAWLDANPDLDADDLARIAQSAAQEKALAEADAPPEAEPEAQPEAGQQGLGV